MLRYVWFDLDDTLYPSTSGLWHAIGERINRYMVERLGMDEGVVLARREHYFKTFGTTLNGLRRDFEVDTDDYLAFVHDLPLAEYIQPDLALNEMLLRLPLAKIIFTNADLSHALRVLERLGVTNHFERIVDIRAMEFVNKPNEGAYLRTFEMLGATAEECVLVEDSPRNLHTARSLGMRTVLVQPSGEQDGADYHIETVLGIEAVLAELLKGTGARCGSPQRKLDTRTDPLTL